MIFSTITTQQKTLLFDLHLLKNNIKMWDIDIKKQPQNQYFKNTANFEAIFIFYSFNNNCRPAPVLEIGAT